MGLFRFLIIGALAYFLYRLVKTFLGHQRSIDRRQDGGIIDEMVQDPQCKTYVPARDAVKRVIKGKEYSFCSKECADSFENKEGM